MQLMLFVAQVVIGDAGIELETLRRRIEDGENHTRGDSSSMESGYSPYGDGHGVQGRLKLCRRRKCWGYIRSHHQI